MPLRARSVRATPDLARIQSLPRRKLSKSVAEKNAARLTPDLALRDGVALRAWQGQLLREAQGPTGVLGALPVGMGKSIPCELLPVLLGSERAVLILPAGLREKTFAERRSYQGSWRMGEPPPRLISREELALEANALLLEQLNPDLVIIDEAHRLSNWKSAAVRRIHRFITRKRAAHGFGSVKVIALTGTLSRKTILGYWHLLIWTHGELAPVPLNRAEAETWAAAIDESSPREGFRPKPGPLGETIDAARAWYLDRLEHTPGVMLVDEDSAVDAQGKPIPLRISVKPIAVGCKRIDRAFKALRERWESPSGEPVTDALSLHRIEGQLGCGYYTYWDPPPPTEWADARRGFAAFVRKRIAETSHAAKPLDTEGMVANAHKGHPAVADWRAVKSMFDPRAASRAEWFSDATIEDAVAWLRKVERAGRVGAVWTLGVELGERLAEAACVPYYGREGTDRKTGRNLHAADPTRSMVCSWQANMQGFNLQAWPRQGILQAPSSAAYLEQIVGRAHRFDPTFRTTDVRITVFATSGGSVDNLRAAVREAGFVRTTARSTQKILRADVRADVELPRGVRWATKDEEG